MISGNFSVLTKVGHLIVPWDFGWLGKSGSISPLVFQRFLSSGHILLSGYDILVNTKVRDFIFGWLPWFDEIGFILSGVELML